jgi:8-oxo-dGTP pyrophosphatase MutT (NUDIX family)
MYVNARAIIEREFSDRQEILLQTRNKPNELQQLELPGGQVDEFESLVQALRREVQEETGLVITHIEGLDTLVVDEGLRSQVECIRPFAVYQTLNGPVDSMGVYFRCQAKGRLLSEGDGTKAPHWVSVQQLRMLLESYPEAFGWVDRAGIQFYLGTV